ncbi:hypothetical protein [Streptomyces flavidovirens]|uniref:hypothetical protein n=1 Tax=Streptomyces flavidovirens TaxID=67298 RepID=UPI0004144DF1|nr:hypothetical protein [Streptomyces flavidovirens]
MTVSQLPAEAEAFARYLRELTALVDTGAGWCGVFWQRDPDGMQACLDGTELPPWDVLEALLQDVAARHGTAVAERETVRALALHGAAAAAHDRRPGGRETLAERLGAMRREQEYAAERERDLTRRLRTSAGGSEGQGLDAELAWARDDHERATARCAELSTRLAALDAPPPAQGRPPAPDSWFRAGAPGLADPTGLANPTDPAGPWPGQSRNGHMATPAGASGLASPTGPAGPTGPWPGESPNPTDPANPTGPWPRQSRSGHTPTPSPPHPAPSRNRGQAPNPPDGLEVAAWLDIPVHQRSARPAPEGRGPGPSPGGEEGWGGGEIPRTPPRRASAPKRRPRGARYAGLDDGDGDADGSDVFAEPAMPEPPVRATAPRGARYAGVAAEEPAPLPLAEDTANLAANLAEDRRAVADTVAVLLQLRAQGRTGEAHVLLCEAAGWPDARRLPVLAEALHRAGLGADWATLLWEVASLPPGRVAGVAATLAAAGLREDGGQLLRQGVVRPAPELAAALLALDDAGGHESEVRALVDALVRVRTPEDVAQVARTDPRRLSPLLLDAARQVSQSRYRDVVHALRVAGAAP